MKRSPRKWVDVYPQGTKEGNEEQKFFIALARNPKWEWRSVAAIAKDSNLTPKRVEEIIQKYYKCGIVIQSTKNEDLWAYWERVPNLGEKDDATITDKDQKDRIDKVANSTQYNGMIGSKPCERSLEAILGEINDKYITNIVMNKLQEFKISCKYILKYLTPVPSCAKHFLKLSKEDTLLRMSQHKEKMPFYCYSHWRACLIADYRNTLRLIKKGPP